MFLISTIIPYNVNIKLILSILLLAYEYKQKVPLLAVTYLINLSIKSNHKTNIAQNNHYTLARVSTNIIL